MTTGACQATRDPQVSRETTIFEFKSRNVKQRKSFFINYNFSLKLTPTIIRVWLFLAHGNLNICMSISQSPGC